MKLVFMYQPTDDLAGAVDVHRDQLGLDEAWREIDDTVAFWLPDRSVQIMLSATQQPAGPMYSVNDVDMWIGEHPDVVVAVDKFEVAGGFVVGLTAPGNNIFDIFDQHDD